MIPCFVIMRDLLTYPKQMFPHLERLGFKPVLFDNDSGYPPLLDYYDHECPYEVIRCRSNCGSQGIWQRLPDWLTGWYAVTDPDLDLRSVPDDFAQKAIRAFIDSNCVRKVAVSLEIDDVPQNSLSISGVKSYETKNWEKRVSDGFESLTETTLAIYRTDRDRTQHDFYNSIRLDRPYTARHLPWYFTHETEFSEEYLYYLKRIDISPYYGSQFKELLAQ